MSMKNYTPGDGILHETKADFGIRTIQNTLHFVQYDKTLPVVAVSLMHNGRSYTLPDRAQIFIRWGKKDRTYVRKECAVNQERNVAYFEVDEQMTIFDGQVNPILEIIMDGKRAGSSPLPIVIDKNPVQDSDVESQVSDSMIDTILKVESQLKNKRDKTFGKKTVYTVDDQGNQSALPYSEAPDADSVVRRTDAGTVKTNKPTEANDAANKEYVDTFIGESVKVIRDCVDEIGITCYEGCSKGLELSHQKSVFELPMINGQTGRASKNLLDIPNLTWPEMNSNNGIITIDGNNIRCERQWKVNIPVGTYTFYCPFGLNTDIQLILSYQNYARAAVVMNHTKLVTFTSTEPIVRLEIYSSNSYNFDNYQLKPQLLKGTYNESNIPAWKQHNDNLVNSHCVVKSTGVNLISDEVLDYANWEEFEVATYRYKLPKLPSGKYIFSGSYQSDIYGYLRVVVYENGLDNDGTIITDIIAASSTNSQPFEINENKNYYLWLFDSGKGGLLHKINTFSLNYGLEAKSYTPHTEDVITDIGELAWNDSIDNVAKKKYLGTSKILTFDGTEPDSAWSINGTNNPNINRFFFIGKELTNVDKRNDIPTTKSNFEDVSSSNQYEGAIGVSTNVGKQYISISIDKDNISDFKQWLSQHPIQVSYALDTITEIDMPSNPLPYTMRIEKGGMELQEPIGNALPYNLTKLYSINKTAQIDANSAAINRHDDQLKRLPIAEHNIELLEERTTYLEMNLNVYDFDIMVKSIRDGRGAQYKTGQQLLIDWKDGETVYKDCPHNIVDHSDYIVLDGDKEVKTHALTLEWHYTIPFGLAYDPSEAMMTVGSNGMPAGSYFFKAAGDNWGGNNDKYYKFTLPSPLTEGMQLRPTNSYNAAMSTGKMVVYANGKSFSELYSVVIEATDSTGAGATNLGTMWSSTDIGSSATYLAKDTEHNTYLNHYHRVMFGYNRWRDSLYRQWLNSEGLNWWKSQNIFDRAPSNIDTLEGFLSRYPTNFTSILKPVKLTTYRNTVTDDGEADITYDKIFLRTMANMNVDGFSGQQNTGGEEGPIWEYYKDLSIGQENLNTNGTFKAWDTYPILIKYALNSKTSPQYVFSRAANRRYGRYVLYVNTSGYVNDDYSAYNGSRCLPACALC